MIEKGYASSQEHWKSYNDVVERFAQDSPKSKDFYATGLAVRELPSRIIDPLLKILPEQPQFVPNENRVPHRQFLRMWDADDISPFFIRS